MCYNTNMNNELEVSTKRPLKGHTAQRLIRELAVSGKSQTQLAEEYGVHQTAISHFKTKHAQEIGRVSEAAADEYAGLWITDKLNRLAELQSLAEELADKPITPRSAEVIKGILRDAAEELGDIPNKAGVNVNIANVKYEIENVNLEDLT